MAVTTTSGEDYDAFMSAVDRFGYKRADFEVKESSQGDVTRSIMVRAKRVSVTITRLSKQVTREYRGGTQKWSANAVWELQQGLFGPA
jgi:hypothetical protein